MSETVIKPFTCSAMEAPFDRDAPGRDEIQIRYSPSRKTTSPSAVASPP